MSLLIERYERSEKNAESVADKILAAIPELASSRKGLSLGASIGICVPHPNASRYEDVLKTADQLMYKAKAEGKNQFRLRMLGTSIS